MNFSAKKEKDKLNKIFSNIPDDKKELVEGLVEDASFMVEQLDVLRKHIKKNGWSEEYQNGANQRGRKNSVEADCYVKLQKSYASVIQQLSSYLPNPKETAVAESGKKFSELVAKGRGYELC